MKTLLTLGGLFLACGLLAQEGLDRMLVTLGTVTRDGGADWAYVLWQDSGGGAAPGKTLALYAKAGDVNSTASFERKAIIMRHTDPLVIAPLLNRSIHLGADLGELDDALSGLFKGILPLGSLTAAQKLATIIRAAAGHPEQEQTLRLLARLHPGVAMSLGLAHAEPIGAGKTTFELRAFDATRGSDLAVVGRVTVEAGNPVLLPAPAAPEQVPETDDLGHRDDGNPRGDLGVGLRWGQTDALRRISLLNQGFNVFRVTRAFAESARLNQNPPTTDQLLTWARSNTNVYRVNSPAKLPSRNSAPILPSRQFEPGKGPGQAGDFVSANADLTTTFVVDDNDRFGSRPGGTPFDDGAQFYYFVTARDILGRDGLVSPGLLVTICRRLPPVTPKGLRVVNEYTYTGVTGRQALALIWEQVPNVAADPIAEYWVYRWSSPSDLSHAQAQRPPNPTVNRIAMIPHVPGQVYQTNLDFGLTNSPTVSSDAGRTVWYTVRAVIHGACGDLPSGQSAPAFGVLRDREGPEAPTGFVEFNCVKAQVAFSDPSWEPTAALTDAARYYFQIPCIRTDPRIAWAEVYAVLINGSNYVGRIAYSPTDSAVTFNVDYPKTNLYLAKFYCRVGLFDGQISEYAPSPTLDPPVGTIAVVRFSASVNMSIGRVPTIDPGSTCASHSPFPSGDLNGEPQGPCITASFHPKTKTWRIYRRIDDGPLTLFKTGRLAPGQLTVSGHCDVERPPNDANICYYVQAFDESGNASPLAAIGCVAAKGTHPLPTPMLSSISQGSNAPTMSLRWFCTPHGVERFEVGIAAWDGGKFVSPQSLPSPLSVPGPTTEMTLSANGETRKYQVTSWQTLNLRSQFLAEDSVFTITTLLETNLEYTVLVRAIGSDGRSGEFSNIQQFKWRPARLEQPQVPWPARSLPSVTADFHSEIAAVQLPTSSFDGLAVRLGRKRIPPTVIVGPTNAAPDDPMRWVFTNAFSGQKVLPLVLYRCQVPNTNYPTVSGDITQVSPLMERIAYSFSQGRTDLSDPFFRLLPTPSQSAYLDLFLIDTQPVIVGARYKYFVARFKSNHELDQVIETNEVEVQ